MTRLTVCISGHGYGHAAQLAVVVNELRKTLPSLSLQIRSPIAISMLSSLFDGAFEHIQTDTDFGMCMRSAVEVDADASHAAYSEYHRGWSEKVQLMAKDLRLGHPDLVLSNISYLEIEAAAATGIPTAALCSLNWADIYSAYCGEMAGAESNLSVIRNAYAQSDLILQVTPGIPMLDYANASVIGPVARIGQNRQSELSEYLSVGSDVELVLVNLGGISMRLPVEQWPQSDTRIWIVPAAWAVDRTDCVSVESLPLSFLDTMCSVDVFITKVGYGALAEAACNDIPTLYLPRGDWPEEPWLIPWFEQNARAEAVTLAQLHSGDLSKSIAQVRMQPEKSPRVEPTGVRQAAERLRKMLV